jgi:hypothetical protein
VATLAQVTQTTIETVLLEAADSRAVVMFPESANSFVNSVCLQLLQTTFGRMGFSMLRLTPNLSFPPGTFASNGFTQTTPQRLHPHTSVDVKPLVWLVALACLSATHGGSGVCTMGCDANSAAIALMNCSVSGFDWG